MSQNTLQMSHYCKFLMLGKEKCAFNTLWKAETRVPERNRPKATAFQAEAWVSQHDGATALFSLLMTFKTGSCSRTPRVVPPHRRVSVSSSMEAVYTWSNRVYSIDSNSDCELLTSQLWLLFFLDPKPRNHTQTLLSSCRGIPASLLRVTDSAGTTGWQTLQEQIDLPPVVWAPGC